MSSRVQVERKVRPGPAASILARSALTFAAVCAAVSSAAGVTQCSEPRLPGPVAHAHIGMVDTIKHPVFHIVEEPGGIRHLVDCEVPTEEYYDALAADMATRHPDATPSVLEHLQALEPFLDTSILSGFSFGVNKAQIVVRQGGLLGHIVGRFGAKPDGERTQAIDEFAPLKEPSHVRQFVGSSNWVRRYLAVTYATAVKILGEYMKPGAVFPEAGLGVGDTIGDKAVKAIKLMCRHAIELSVMNEAAAIDGSRPLEQIADACGIAWESTNVQMVSDLSSFRALLMVGKVLPRRNKLGLR